LAPKRIAEIGVRYGYGAHALCLGGKCQLYHGYDLPGLEGGVPGSDTLAYAETLLSELGVPNVKMIVADSRHLTMLDGQYDLIHVDGGHTEEVVWNDLRLAFQALAFGGSMLVDDYTAIKAVHEATNRFVQENYRHIRHLRYFDGLKGDLLITRD
jgi:predicted O-methyltransferase YrrM